MNQGCSKLAQLTANRFTGWRQPIALQGCKSSNSITGHRPEKSLWHLKMAVRDLSAV